MRRYLFAAAVILGLVVAVGSSAGDRDGDRSDDPSYGTRAFNGLWEGIDSFDGSTQRLSITCGKGGACDVRLNDTAFTLSCPNQIGFAHGQGSIEGSKLVVDLTLTCANDEEPSETQLNEFVLDRRYGTLTNYNDDPVPVPNVFHKISQ